MDASNSAGKNAVVAAEPTSEQVQELTWFAAARQNRFRRELAIASVLAVLAGVSWHMWNQNLERAQAESQVAQRYYSAQNASLEYPVPADGVDVNTSSTSTAASETPMCPSMRCGRTQVDPATQAGPATRRYNGPWPEVAASSTSVDPLDPVATTAASSSSSLVDATPTSELTTPEKATP